MPVFSYTVRVCVFLNFTALKDAFVGSFKTSSMEGPFAGLQV